MAWTTPERIPNIAEVNDPDRVYNTHIIDNLSYLKDYSAQSLVNLAAVTTIVENSAVETTIMSYDIAGAVAGDIYEYVLFGDSLNNSGSSATTTWKAYLGGVALLTAATAVSTSAVARPWEFRGYVFVPTLTSQVVYGSAWSGAAGAPGTMAMSSADIHGCAFNTATNNFASPVTLSFTAQQSSGTSTNVRLAAYSVNRVRKLS